MNDKLRLVYSTEQGQVAKAMKKKKKNKLSPTVQTGNKGKQGIRIRREVKGRGGKTVCVIDGLPLPDAELKVFLKKLKGQLGAGGAIKNSSLEIQGDHREKLLQLLEKEGYRAKLAGG